MKVLLVRFSSLGDVVLTTGPLEKLRQLRPDFELDFLTSEAGADLLAGNRTELDHCFILNKKPKFSELIKLYKRLPKYDIIIDWQGNLKSQLLRFFSRARFFTIQKHSRQRRAFVKKRKFREKLNKHIVEKYYQVLKKAFDLKDQCLEDLRPKLFAQKIIFHKENNLSDFVAIHPYASQKNKIWPYTNTLIEKLHQRDLSVVITGQSNSPMEFVESKKTLNLTNKTSLRETLAVIKKAKVLISTDSGPMHLGVALKIPTLALFGPTTKEFGFAPLFKDTKVLEIEDLECRPCHVHGGDFCPKKHFKCMKDLSVDKVLGELDKFLKNTSYTGPV